MGHTGVGVTDGQDTGVNGAPVTARVLTAAPATDTGQAALLVRVISALGALYSTTDAIYSGTTPLTPKWAFANVAASQTDSVLVAAVSLKKIRVIAAFAVAGATATTLTFNTKPGGSGTAITPLFANAANGGFVLPENDKGWFQTGTGEGLSVTTGAGATTGIHVQYLEV